MNKKSQKVLRGYFFVSHCRFRSFQRREDVSVGDIVDNRGAGRRQYLYIH